MGPMGGIHHFFQHHLFQPPFFPVQLSQLQATFTFHDISDGDHLTILPHVGVDVFPLNHPGGASGFRLQVNKKVMCYVSDTEHEPTKGPSKTILNAIKDADLIVYDTSFTDEEYVHFQGWGHSTWQEGVRLCLDAGVKRMALYHHDPSHTDTVMDAIELKAQSLFPGAFVARQGMTVIL
jgi:phosphoribosyl 1,2-cyclic phosphodiesterase